MADKKLDVEIDLESVEIESSALREPEAQRLFKCELIWPKVGTASRSAALPITLQKGRWTAEGRPWLECVVTKDSIQGRIGITVGVTGRISDALSSFFSRTSGASIAKIVAGVIGGFGPDLVGDLLAAPLNAASKAMAKDRQPETLYRAAIDFETSSLPSNGAPLKLELPLLAVEDVMKRAAKPAPKQVGAATMKKLVAKGSKVGTCVITIRAL